MSDKNFDGPSATPLFEDVLAEFLQAEEQGLRPAPQLYLDRFPDIAGLLNDFFANREWFGAQAPKLTPVAPRPEGAGVTAAFPSLNGLTANQATPATAARFAGYEVLGELGRGGMGIVYKARQINPERLVALKVIRPDRLEALSAEERRAWVDRFRREARLVAALDQPTHIVTLYEVGEFEGQSFFSMRLMEGGSLAQRLRERKAEGPEPAAAARRVSEQRANARLLAQVARAVDYAHRRGILHRDLKPANILLDKAGEPLVTDFGLARRLDETGSLVESGIEGTAAYMSPEQARAAPGAATTAADVYSLGAILYELLTGRPPFRGANDVETLIDVQTREPMPPRQIERRVNRDLETICLKCLRKEPQDRYASAAALADDLENWLSGRPITARPLGTMGRLWHWCRREPALAGAVGFAAVALIAGIVVSSVFGFHWRRAAEDLEEAVAVAVDKGAKLTVEVAAKEELRKRAVEAERNTKHMAAGLLVNLGVQACAKGDVALGMLQLARGMETAPEDENLQELVRLNLAGWRPTTSSSHAPLAHPGVVAGVGFSPDGRTLWALSTGTVRIEERKWGDGQTRITRVFQPEMIGDPFFGAQGVSLFGNDPKFPRPVTAKGRLLLWEVSTGKPIETSLPESLQVLAVSPDMRFVLTARRQDKNWDFLTTVQVWDLTAKKLVGGPVELNDSVRFARFSPDSKLAVTAGERGIAVWSAEEGKLLQHISSGPGELVQLTFGPDGKYLALVEASAEAMSVPQFMPPVPGLGKKVLGRLSLWKFEAGKMVSLPVRESVNPQSAVAVGPEGRMLLTASPTDVFGISKVTLLDRVTGRTVGTIEPAGTLAHAVFSAGGKRLLTVVTQSDPNLRSGGIAELWDAAKANRLGAPLLFSGTAVVTTSSPNGKLLITAGGEGASGEAQLWDLTTSRPLGRPFRHPGKVFAVAFSPDNQMIATGCQDGTARLWDVQRIRPIRPVVQLERVVAWSTDGRRALVKGQDETVRLHDTATGKACGEPVRYTAKNKAIALSPNGRTVLIANGDKTAQLWDGVTGQAIGKPLSHAGEVTNVGFRGDGRIAVTEAAWLGKKIDGDRSLWNAESGESLGFQKRPGTGILEITASPDARTLLMSPMGFRSSAWGMEAATGKQIGKSMLHNGIVTDAHFSPDSQTVLTVGGRSGSWEEARLWKVATGEPAGQSLQHSGRIRAASFSADGKTVLTGSEDGTAQLWVADTGRPLGPPMPHSGPVLAVAISPDNKLIATGCADQTARLWHVPTKKPIGPPLPHPASVSFVVFGEEGRALTTRSIDGTVRVWEVPAPMKGTIDQIRLWAQVSTGMELHGDVARLLDDSELEGRWKRLHDSGGMPR